MRLTLTTREKEFIEKARESTIVSFGIGSTLTASTPRLEILGGMIIEYEDQERAEMVWKLILEQKKEKEGDF